jgi:hypothetical protein
MTRRRSEIWACDCETDPFKVGRIPQPFIWGAYEIYSKRYEVFGSRTLFVEFFRERKAKAYFHNGGRFDAHYLRPYFDSDQNILIINGRIARFKIGKTEFRDSFNLIPVALATYQKDEFDYRILEEAERSKPENVVKIEKYLKSDCVNLGSLLTAFFERYGQGLTQAGTALTYWSKHYNGGHKPRQSAAQFERYRPYYYGGRVECFRRGVGDLRFSIVDKNSAYPHAMLKAHPISCEAVFLSSLPTDAQLSQCFISLRGIARGCFPFRLPSGELVFPRDGLSRTYHITGWEYLAAVRQSSIEVEEILEVHHFRETVSFKEYINFFYLERQAAKANGDKAGDIFSKLFMTSCYGAFAMNPENYHEYLLSSLERKSEHIAEGYATYHPWGDGRELLWRKLSIETQKRMYKNIATAASITGYVRAALFEDLLKVRAPLYCDTDSIAAEGTDGLPLGGALGQWKVEAECDQYAIAGKKLYAFRSLHDGSYKIACKGVALQAADIIRIAQGEKIHYEPEVPTYSITRPAPRFTGRTVRMTAQVQG